MVKEQHICNRCIMDISAKEIVFYDDGCNFCLEAQKAFEKTEEEKWSIADHLDKIRDSGKGKEYDCLIGLSGGADSSFVLHNIIKLGLRPLCFSLDNGWNDPKADENIMLLVEGMKVPFIRYNINISKFKELQAMFISAGVKNIEIPTDHVLMAASYDLAKRYGIKYIITGGNVATESIMPVSWGYNARDLVHIKDIYKKYSHKDLEGLPVCSLLKFNYYRWIKKIKFFPLLDYIFYNREEAIETLSKEYGYKHPGEKHCESTWTTWFQNFYLYEKFGIDKRKAHLSSLIVSGQITREEALKIVQTSPVYPMLDIEKKVLLYKKHEHSDFKQDERLYNFISRLVKLVS